MLAIQWYIKCFFVFVNKCSHNIRLNMVQIKTCASTKVEVVQSSPKPGLYDEVPDGPWLGRRPRIGAINLDILELLGLSVLHSMDLLPFYGDPVNVLAPLQGLRDDYGRPDSYRGLDKVFPVVTISINC